MTDWKDKNILIVGASSGIGKEIAEKAVSNGANVYTASRRKVDIEGIERHIELDVLDDASGLSDELPAEWKGLVYAPGSINLKPFQSLKVQDFQNDFDINVLGAVKVIQASLKALKKSKNASVVCFSTVAANNGMNFHASIAAAKGALEAMVRTLSAEYARFNIRFNVVAPSLTDTPLAEQLLSTDEKKEASNKRHPLGRYGEPGDIASAALYFLGDEASWITGQTLGVDGGMDRIRSI